MFLVSFGQLQRTSGQGKQSGMGSYAWVLAAVKKLSARAAIMRAFFINVPCLLWSTSTHVGAGEAIRHGVVRTGIGRREEAQRKGCDHESLFHKCSLSPLVNFNARRGRGSNPAWGRTHGYWPP